MPTIKLNINSKEYNIGVDSKDENLLLEIASDINKKIDQLKHDEPLFFMGLNNERLFLYLCISILTDLKKDTKELDSNKEVEVDEHGQVYMFDKQEIPQEISYDQLVLTKVDAKIQDIQKIIKNIQHIVKI